MPDVKSYFPFQVWLCITVDVSDVAEWQCKQTMSKRLEVPKVHMITAKEPSSSALSFQPYHNSIIFWVEEWSATLALRRFIHMFLIGTQWVWQCWSLTHAHLVQIINPHTHSLTYTLTQANRLSTCAHIRCTIFILVMCLLFGGSAACLVHACISTFSYILSVCRYFQPLLRWHNPKSDLLIHLPVFPREPQKHNCNKTEQRAKRWNELGYTSSLAPSLST